MGDGLQVQWIAGRLREIEHEATLSGPPADVQAPPGLGARTGDAQDKAGEAAPSTPVGPEAVDAARIAEAAAAHAAKSESPPTQEIDGANGGVDSEGAEPPTDAQEGYGPARGARPARVGPYEEPVV